jgi:hypothetical protein
LIRCPIVRRLLTVSVWLMVFLSQNLGGVRGAVAPRGVKLWRPKFKPCD